MTESPSGAPRRAAPHRPVVLRLSLTPALALGAVLLAVSACRCGATPSASDGVDVASHPARAARGGDSTSRPPSPEAAPAACGICFAHNWQNGGIGGYGSESARDQIRRLAELGARSISLTPFGWMASTDSTEVRWSRNWGASETFERLRREAEFDRSIGMSLMLKPHIWIRGGGWRGDIAPDVERGGWRAWFASYEEFIVAYAELAEELAMDWFVIGVEFGSSSSSHEAEWRAIIAAARAAYGGKLTYAANWDEVERVPFWDALDAVGVQMFAPLADDELAGYEELNRGAQRWLERFEAVASRVDKPLILTEVGYINRPGGAVEPWVWPERAALRESAAADRMQADAYRAIFDTFGQSPHVEYLYWWKWFSDPSVGEEGPVGYSPRGKPAERVLDERCPR